MKQFKIEKEFSMIKTEEALAMIGGHVDEELVRSKYYFDKLTYDINYLASKFLKKAICSILTSLSCFILVT